MIQCVSYTLLKPDPRSETGYSSFQLAVVKNHRIGLIAYKTSRKIIIAYRRQKFRGYIVGLKLDSQTAGYGLVNLIPCKGFIGGDLEYLAYGVRISQQPDKPLGKISAVCHCPKRGTVSVNYNGFSLKHTFYDLPASFSAVNT